MNKLINRIRNFVSNTNQIYVAMAVSFLMFCLILFYRGIVYNGDSMSYIWAWYDSLSQGEIHDFRTPVYPFLIGAGRYIFGFQHLEVFVILVQVIVFYLCGYAFSKMILSVISRRKVALITVFIYFLFYPIVNFLPVIGTEALAFSLTSLWIVCTWQFIRQARWGYGIAIGLLTLTETMLRPSLLILVFVIIGLAISGAFIKRYRKNAVLLLLTIPPTAGVYVAYAAEIERQIGVNTISVVSVYNKYYMARQYNDVFPDLLPDNPEAIALMYRYHKEGDLLSKPYVYAQWAEMEELNKSGIMNVRGMEDYCTGMKKYHADVWYGNIWRNIVLHLKSFGPVKNACNYLIIILYTVVFCLVWLKFRQFPIFNFMLLMIGGGSLLSVFLYAQNDFGRLMLPTSAALILMGGQMLNCLHLRPMSIRLSGVLPK